MIGLNSAKKGSLWKTTQVEADRNSKTSDQGTKQDTTGRNVCQKGHEASGTELYSNQDEDVARPASLRLITTESAMHLSAPKEKSHLTHLHIFQAVLLADAP